jgi:hypothetical protein
MGAMKTKAVSLMVAIAVLFAAGAYAALAGKHGGGTALGGPDYSRTPRLHLSGHVKNLYPGARKRIRVRVENRFDHPVRLRFLRGKARATSRRCSRHNLTIGHSRRHPWIPSHGSRPVRFRIGMRARAPNACQGVSFPLHFTAKAGRFRWRAGR